jgi:hypothetical protein
MKSLTTDTTEQFAAKMSTANPASELITVSGAVPPEFARWFQSISPPRLPELARLPRPGQRDPIASSSRTWLVETDAKLPPTEKFLFRVRQPGKIRGAVFINVAKLLAFLKKAEATDKEGGAK